MNGFISSVITFLARRFSLHEDSAHDSEIVESIGRNVEFKGSNLWSLIFAIFIASIGLNVNSTAVIIGAMLISPLMGPIMGIGLGMGINDLELIRKALKNLAIATIISIAVSALYFFLTPLHEAKSELLARTTPSIWDVFIALFGGLAGIVGGTRKEKSNVIPGVAIATALMPPLCTAGFGIAVGNFYYFIGAFYLFFINSVFICISSYLVVRYMKLPKKAFEDKKREKRVMKYILYVIIATALPSIYLTYKIVEKSIFESNANSFIKNEFQFPKTHIINKTFRYDNDRHIIDLLLIGDTLQPEDMDTLKKKLARYKIPNTVLSITQGLNAQREIDFSQVKESILKDVFAKQAANDKSNSTASLTAAPPNPIPDLKDELKALYPTMTAYTISKQGITVMDTVRRDSVVLFVCYFPKQISKTEIGKLTNWLKLRIKADSIVLLSRIEQKRKQ